MLSWFCFFLFFKITCRIKCAEGCVLFLVRIIKTCKENQIKLLLKGKFSAWYKSTEETERDGLVLYPKYLEGQDRYKGENYE